jgi:arylsulfatase A-like enzyme
MNVTRRKVLKDLTRAALGSTLLSRLQAQPAPVTPSPTSKPNVLLFMIDDQNDWLGCLGHRQVQTPNIDQLAKRGRLFADAHCPAPLCNPARNSIMTGLRPGSIGIYSLIPGIRDVPATQNAVTLPQTFTQNGYFTYTCGKIYHDGSIKPTDQPREFNVWGPRPGPSLPPRPFVHLRPPKFNLIDWGAWPQKDEDVCDYKIADAAIQALQGLPSDKPFFVSCGFRLPHVPCFAPQKWLDLYPEEPVELPDVLDTDRDETPRFSWYLHWKLPEPRLHSLKEGGQWRSLVRCYMACSSFMDAQLGRVMAALDATGRADNTIIVLCSDHGWHLGDKLITGKNSLWQSSTHVPLIMAGPTISAGATCPVPVQTMDIYPTLLELCQFPPRAELEGHSLVPQLQNAEAPRAWPAICTDQQNNHAVIERQWRYIHYADGSEELYDRQKDPAERSNLADHSAYEATKKELKTWLPQVNLPAVPASRGRVLRYDPATAEANWEGHVIAPDAPIPD